MREAARHRLLIGRVLGEALERAAETPREIADLVARGRTGEVAADSSVSIDRGFRFVAKPPDARRQPRRVHGQRHRADEERREHDIEKPCERAIALGKHRVGRLLDDHCAFDLVADPDRVGCGDDDGLAVGRGPAIDGKNPGQCALEIPAGRHAASRALVAEVFGRLLQHARVHRLE